MRYRRGLCRIAIVFKNSCAVNSLRDMRGSICSLIETQHSLHKNNSSPGSKIMGYIRCFAHHQACQNRCIENNLNNYYDKNVYKYNDSESLEHKRSQTSAFKLTNNLSCSESEECQFHIPIPSEQNLELNMHKDIVPLALPEDR